MSIGRKTILRAALSVLAALISARDARAQDRQEYVIELDAHHKLSARTRLYLSGSVTDVESAGSLKGQGGAYVDVTLKGALRERLHLADWSRSRNIWVRVGYSQLRTWDGQFEDVSERRGVVQLTIRAGAWRNFQLTHRVGFDYRDLEGQDSQRYRYRLDVEREMKVGQTAVIPYVRGEVFYDTRYSAWSKQSYQLGSEIDLDRHWRIEPYFAVDKDTRPTRMSPKLLVGADGGESTVRTLAGIAQHVHDYRQTALVCTAVTERPHGDTARQRFLAGGPLAFLPLADPHRCAIVWSLPHAEAQRLTGVSDAEFRRALEDGIGEALGTVVDSGPRRAFLLSRAHAERYVEPRLALIGDAAHQIHPLAGQGANLGLMDAATLAEVILDAKAARQDIGALRVLRRYERWRKGENLAMMWLMDGFNELFGSDALPLRIMRNAGLTLANLAGPVKRRIIRRAMGIEGDLPRLALTGCW